jgi:hypothetical protein
VDNPDFMKKKKKHVVGHTIAHKYMQTEEIDLHQHPEQLENLATMACMSVCVPTIKLW